jgi:hypothetical protein
MSDKDKDVFGWHYNESGDGFCFFVPLFPLSINVNE